MSKELNKKQLIAMSGGILSSAILLHYLEETSHLGVFKQTVKRNVSRTKQDLITMELDWFDKVYNIDQKDLGGTLIDNSLSFISKMQKNPFSHNLLFIEEMRPEDFSPMNSLRKGSKD